MHRRYVKEPSAGIQVSKGANEKRFINKTYIYRFLKQRSFASSRGTHSKTGKNAMKPLIRILSLWLAALCFGACTDDDLIDGTPTPEPETGIVIRLSAGDLEQTRTELTSQANLQHVEKVYALLYKGHGDTATFYACDELNWNPKQNAESTGVQEQREEFLLPQSENLAKGAYTVLCVGLDDESGETYGLTPEKMQGFSTLKDAKATLAQDKGKEDIAKSELFAGWNQFHFAPDSLNIVEVEMKRRVAGVLCYLTDVPYNINDGTDKYRITKIQLRLFKEQNTSIKLCREEITGDGYPDDFGNAEEVKLDGSEIIAEQSMIGFTPNADKTLYTIPAKTMEQDGMVTQANSILMGAYMIPIEYEQTNQEDSKLIDDVTLQVVMYGVPIKSEDENVTDDTNAVIVRSFPAINDDIDLEEMVGSDGSVSYEPTKNYPIRPNIIYHIGNKPSDEEEGTPESLAGTEVKIGVKCWENETVDVEFPNVPIELGMEIRNGIPFTMLTEDENAETTPHYIFDCIGTTAFQLYIYPSVQYEKWRIKSIPIDDNGNEIVDNNSSIDHVVYFKHTEEEYYSIEYDNINSDRKGTFIIPIAITDYADPNARSLKRKVKLKLVGLEQVDNGWAEEESSAISMIVEQYNAIIINLGDNTNPDYRGFSYFDWHAVRNPENGYVNSRERLPWGYMYNNTRGPGGFSIYGQTPSQTEGQENYFDAKDVVHNKNNDSWYRYWDTSAINKCAQDGCSILPKTNYGVEFDLEEEEAKWYLPSTKELTEFFNYCIQSNSIDDVNIVINEYYWTCYAVQARTEYAWAYKISSDGDINPDPDSNLDYGELGRGKNFYARQCCKIQGY